MNVGQEDGFAVSNIDIDDFAIQLQLELIEPTDLAVQTGL